MRFFRRPRTQPGEEAGSDESGAAPPPPDPDRQVFLIAYLVLVPLYVLPLWLTPLPPGLEVPFHLSLGDLLIKGSAGAPGPYAAVYDASLRLSPYLLYYLWLVLLGPLLGLLAAHKLIMSLCIAALPLCLGRLLGVCRRSRLPALLAFPLGYGMSFFYGFASFSLALPLCVLLLAQVADNIDDERDMLEEGRLSPALLRDGLLLLLALLLLLCHLEAFLFGVLAALVVLLLAEEPMVHRVRAGLCFVPSLATLCWWRFVTLHDGPPGPALRRAGEVILRHRLADLGPGRDAAAIGGEALRRLEAFPQHLLAGLGEGVPGTIAAVLGAVLLFYLALGTLSVFLRGGDRQLARLGGAGIAALLIGLLFYLGLPRDVGELGVTMVYPRAAVLVALLLPLAVPAWLKRLPRFGLALAAVPALAACAWYGALLCQGFVRYGEEIADFRQVLAQVPPDGKALGLVFDRRSRVLGVGSALAWLPHYYPVVRGGAAAFMAQPACALAHMPCRVKDPALLPPDPGPYTPQRMEARQAGGPFDYFDYFITRGAPPPQQLFGQRAVSPIASAGAWVVYRKRDGAAEVPAPQAAGPAGGRRVEADGAPAPTKPAKRRRRRRPR